MRAMLLSDVRLALSHLLDDKGPALESTAAGRLYAPRLHDRKAAIAALPVPGPERQTLVDAIAEADVRHDAFGAALWHYLEAVLRAPDSSSVDRAAAERIRQAFIPQLSVLRLSHATQAAQAHQKRARIAEHSAELARFSVPGESSTLAAWVDGFVSAGEMLGELLIARSELRTTEGTRGDAARLRSEVIGWLTRLRTALADEFESDPAAWREHDAELFGFIDELAARREKSQRRRSVTTKEASEAPEALESLEPLEPLDVEPSDELPVVGEGHVEEVATTG